MAGARAVPYTTLWGSNCGELIRSCNSWTVSYPSHISRKDVERSAVESPSSLGTVQFLLDAVAIAIGLVLAHFLYQATRCVAIPMTEARSNNVHRLL